MLQRYLCQIEVLSSRTMQLNGHVIFHVLWEVCVEYQLCFLKCPEVEKLSDRLRPHFKTFRTKQVTILFQGLPIYFIQRTLRHHSTSSLNWCYAREHLWQREGFSHSCVYRHCLLCLISWFAHLALAPSNTGALVCGLSGPQQTWGPTAARPYGWLYLQGERRVPRGFSVSLGPSRHDRQGLVGNLTRSVPWPSHSSCHWGRWLLRRPDAAAHGSITT